MTFSDSKKLPKKIKTFITVAAALLVTVCLVIVIGLIAGRNNPENSKIIVYRKGNTNIIRINDKELPVSLEGANDFKCDKKSGRVFFTTESSYSDGLYDLYYVEEKKGEITSPKIIDFAIEKNFDIASGKVYYLKFNNNASANDGCVCDIEKNKIEVFSENVENIYPLDGTESVYFIKMHGSTQVLYEYNGGSPVEISRGVSNIFSFSHDEKPHIVFEKKSASDNTINELYIVYSGESPYLICDRVSEVLYDNYKAGGNLYYFTTAVESISWSYVISDGYAETDSAMKRPVRSDFFSFFGISTEYNEALREYQDKLVRDEIRETLNIMMENGEFSAPVFTAFAYNEEGTFKIAEKIDPTRVYSVSPFGEPKIVFEGTQVTQAQTDMDSLVAIAQRSTMSEVLDYARSLVSNSVVSKGIEIAVYSEDSGSIVSSLNEYDKSKTLFSFSDNGEKLFAFERGSQTGKLTLYSNSINTDHKASERISVSSDVTSYWINEDEILYMKSDIGKDTGDIYSYNGEESLKISNAANAFMLSGDEGVFVLKDNNISESEPIANYYFYLNNKEIEVEKDIVVSSFVHQNGSAAFITAKNDSLYIFTDGKTGLISDSVDEIMLFS